MRLYGKKDDGDKRFLRVELILKRRNLRRLGLEFPYSKINKIDWLKFFNFRELDVEGLRDYLVWLQREMILEEFKKPRRLPGSGIVCHTDFSISMLEEMSLVEQVRYIKKILYVKNYHRFLKPLDPINKRFMETVTAQRFIPE
jgi:hypothetical protein